VISLPRIRIVVLCLVAFTAAGMAQTGAPQAYKWTVQYLIDNSQPVFRRSQQVYPRGNRALAISPDGNFLYLGYNQSFSSAKAYRARDARSTDTGEVRKVDLRVSDYEKATKVALQFKRAKAIAVDAENHVYLADGDSIEIYDGDLQNVLATIPMDQCEGVAVTHEAGSTVLYATERGLGELHRYLIDSRLLSNGYKTTPAGLGADGVMPIQGAKSLRGVAVDGKGRIWIADPVANKVFRVNPDGSALASVDVRRAMAISFMEDTALVTRGTDRQIALISPDMVVTGNLSVPWEELELSAYGNNRDGSLSGIAVVPGGKGFFVADEHGQTANQRSTYGTTDQNSEVINGKLYTDAFQDDNEPVLRAVPVEVQEAVATGASAPAASPAAPPAVSPSASPGAPAP